MSNTDSVPFQDYTAAVSMRELERGSQVGSGWDPLWHTPLDMYANLSDRDFRLGLNAAQTTLLCTSLRLATWPHRAAPAALLPSQLATLEAPQPDEHAITLDIAAAPAALVDILLAHLELAMTPTPTFTQVILETGPDGRARFREQAIALAEGKPAARLSPLMAIVP
jgi:hypothetical protein